MVKTKIPAAPVNRKLLIWLFVLTGFLSLFLWWRGWVLKNGLQSENKPIVKHTIEDSDTPTPNVRNVKKIKEFVEKMEKSTASDSGRYAVYVYHTADKWGYGFNEKEKKPALSTMKLPVFITAIKKIENNEIKLNTVFTLTDSDRSIGSGPMQYKEAGTNFSLDEVLNYLGKNSDNTAWLMLNRRWGKQEMQNTINGLGLTDSDYFSGVITAVDTAKMWEYLYSDKYSSAIKTAIIRYLSESIYEDRIPMALKDSDGKVIMHKVGTDIDVWADSGVIGCKESAKNCNVKPLIIVILNEGVKRSEASEKVIKLVKMVWEFENTL